MKKILSSRIFLVIICAVIFTSIGVMADNILASEVDYKDTTVDLALDDLYSKSGSVQYVGGSIYNTNTGTTYFNVQGGNTTVNEKMATVSNDGVFTLKKDGRVKVCYLSKGHECNGCSNARLYHNSTVAFESTNRNEILGCTEFDVLKNDTIKYQIASNNTWGIGSFWIFYVEDAD